MLPDLMRWGYIALTRRTRGTANSKSNMPLTYGFLRVLDFTNRGLKVVKSYPKGHKSGAREMRVAGFCKNEFLHSVFVKGSGNKKTHH